ncbi:unnamed protein product, partial [Discosporangium mesarthrocarpum]
SFGPAIAGLCAIAVILPTVASAQLQLRRPTPVIENQPATQAPEAAPVTEGTPPVTSPPADITVAPRPLDGAGITVNRLESVDPDAIGLIGVDQGGFPPALWQGAKWAVVSGLMPRLPAGLSSPVLRDLTRRLLVSRASVPVGKPLAASFVALRIDRLLAMGDIGNALALLKITPDARRDESLARTRIEALFFDNNNSDACKAVQGAGRDYSGLYWSQAQAFCHALSGAHSRASLIADLLRERENEVEKVFFAAIDALAGAKGGASPALRVPSALHLSMIRAAGFQLPADIVQTAQASVLRTVALSPNAALDVRLIAAEKAHGIGALTDSEILRFYQGIPFSKSELSGPISTAEESWTPRSRALLVRAAASQSVALAKAEVLRRAWQLGEERDGFAEIAGTSAPVVAGIEPAVELLWFAKDAARVLFAAGRPDRALAWYGIVAADRERIEEAREAEAALWPLALLAAPAQNPAQTMRVNSDPENRDRLNNNGAAANRAKVQPLDPARLRRWFEARRQADVQAASRQATAFYTLLEATGRAVPAELWQALLDRPFAGTDAGGNRLNPVWTHSLEAASTGARIGETVLLVTVGAGDVGEENLRLADAARMISALRRVGLEADARRLAVETAMAAGL